MTLLSCVQESILITVVSETLAVKTSQNLFVGSLRHSFYHFLLVFFGLSSMEQGNTCENGQERNLSLRPSATKERRLPGVANDWVTCGSLLRRFFDRLT